MNTTCWNVAGSTDTDQAFRMFLASRTRRHDQHPAARAGAAV
ncbi:ribbon-helix-helix domain-containing protein [Pseudomonas baltica]